eukprot:gb/GECH01001979.1/.p1 GENE.gb/GECH01001979.1/~~gb/GECH01001979.1/.p1  ORF type:complete len:1731 (+),score=425.85 gb/GECH01001979.1/:1-5193(+)
MVREGVPPPPEGHHAHKVVAQNTPKQQLTQRRPSHKMSYLRLALDIDLARKAIVGYTDLFLSVLEPLNELRIQIASQCDVSGVSVEGIGPVSFKHASSISEETFMKSGNDNQFSLLKGCEEIVADSFTNEFGFLSVYLPHTVKSDTQVIVRIFYELVNPYAGVYFVSPDDSEDTLPYMYTHNQIDGANLWLPSQEGNTMIPFEAEITTHPDVVVISSGELLRQELSETKPLKVSYIQQKTPILIRHIGLAVGVFKTIRDPNLNNVLHFYPEGSSNTLVTQRNMEYTARFFSQAKEFMEDFLDTSYSDMFTTYKQVFIGRPYTKTMSYATFSLISEDMILDPRVIEGTMDTRVEMAHLVAKQFFSQYIVGKRWSDIWLMLGISGYLAGKFMQKVFGDNEYRYFLHQEMKKLDCPEVHLQQLYCEDLATPSEIVNPMMIRKSGLVLYMIENQIGASNMQKLLNHILSDGLRDMEQFFEQSPSTPLTASSSGGINSPFMNGEPSPNFGSTPSKTRMFRDDKQNRRQKSTKEFIRMIRRSFGTDLKQFADYWIFSVGIPKFHCGFRYDPKRGMLEFALKQIRSPAPDAKLFQGPINIRIHEVDGTYDHTIRVEEEINYYEFLCHTKPRKQRQRPPPNYPFGSGKETEKSQIPQPAVPANQPETGPGTEIPIHWVRVDPELELARIFELKQPEDMWVWQLETDRDVIAQEEALHALFEFNTSKESMRNLDAFVYNTIHYYRMRILALHALAKYANSTLKFEALDMLYQYLKYRHYDKTQTYIKPNNFSDFAEYFIKKELPLAIASVRDDAGMSPSDVTDFLIDLLKNNDNSENEYVDSYYVGSIIRALGMVRTERIDRAEKHIEHMLLMDSMLPSHQRCLTRYAMASLTELQVNRLSALKIEVFWDFVKKKHIYSVRIEALHCLFQFYSASTFREELDFKEAFLRLLEIIEDPKEEPKMQHKVAVELAHCIYQTVPNTQVNDQSPVGVYINFLRGPHDSNRSIVKRLWRLLRGAMCEHDTRLRLAVFQLYNIIWGIHAPLCFDPSQKFDVVPPEDFLSPEPKKKKQPTPTPGSTQPSLASKSKSALSQKEAKTKTSIDSSANHKKRKVPSDEKSAEQTGETAPPSKKKSRRDSKESGTKTKTSGTKEKKKKKKKSNSTKTSPEKPLSSSSSSSSILSSSQETKPSSSIKLRFKVSSDNKPEQIKEKKTTVASGSSPSPQQTSLSVNNDIDQNIRSPEEETTQPEVSSISTSTPSNNTEPLLSKQKSKKKSKKSTSKSKNKTKKSTSVSVTASDSKEKGIDKTEKEGISSSNQLEKQPQYKLTHLSSKLKPLAVNNRVIVISLDNKINFIAQIYNSNSTADAVYRTIPMEEHRLNGIQGIAFFQFALPSVKEENPTDLVKRGELAFWIEGTAICIGLEPSPYSLNSKEIRLYCPCNIFGIIDWSISPRPGPFKDVGKPVCLLRPRRIVVAVGDIEMYLDLYHCPGGDEILRMLPLDTTELHLFSKSFFFTYSTDNFDPSVRQMDPKKIGVAVKKRINFGDVALWIRGNSIVVGSGYTDYSSSSKDTPVLLEECPIIGTLASNRMQVIRHLPTKTQSTSISVYRRIVEINIENHARFLVLLYDTVTADQLWEALPWQSTLATWSELIYFPVELNGQRIEDEPSAKRVLEPEEMAFWTRESAVCIAYGYTPVSTRVPGTLKEPCNVWGRAIDVDLQTLLRSAHITPDTSVSVSKIMKQ